MRRLATPTRLFVVGFLLLQCAWVLTMPPFRGIDEFDHVYRAAAVAGGDWVADEAPDDGRGLLLAVPSHIVEAAHGQCAELGYTGPDNCSAAGQATEGRVLVASGAATYHPAFYWVVGTAGAPFEGAVSLYVMRVVAALLCALFVGLAAWSASRSPGPWPLLGVAVALTPVLVYSTTIVAPNGLEMAAGVALWASLLRVRVEPDLGVARRLLVVAISAAVTMCTLRLLGPLWVVLIAFTVVVFDPRGCWAVARRHRRLIGVGALAIATSAANFAAWLILPDPVIAPAYNDIGDDQLRTGHVVVWMAQSIAAFPYRDQFGPVVAYLVVSAAAIWLLWVGVRSATAPRQLVIAGSLAAALVIPVVATLLTMGGREIIWQGRYGLPFGVGFVLLAAWAIGERDEPPAMRRPAVAVGALAYAVALLACLVKVRSAELVDNPASVADPAWHTPSPALLVVLVVLATASVVAAIAATRRTGRPALVEEPVRA